MTAPSTICEEQCEMKMREKQRGREGLKQSEERERIGIHMIKHLPKVIQDVTLVEGMIKDIQ